MRWALVKVGFIVLVGMMAGCVSGPSPDREYMVTFKPPEAGENFVRLVGASEYKVAITGMLQRESYDNEQADRNILTTPEDLAPILKSFSSGLSEVPEIHSSLQNEPIADFVCPPLKDFRRDSFGRSTWGLTNQTCKFRDSLGISKLIESLRLRGISHLILLVGESHRVAVGTEVTWGLVGGFGAAAPAFTTETTIKYLYKVSAIVYDLINLRAVIDADASTHEQAAYGVMLVIWPYYVGPSESGYLSALARAVGIEIGRRFTNVATSTDIQEIAQPPASPIRELHSQGPGDPCDTDVECKEGLVCYRMSGSCQKRE
jgi:hypothetical protein